MTRDRAGGKEENDCVRLPNTAKLRPGKIRYKVQHVQKEGITMLVGQMRPTTLAFLRASLITAP